MKRILTLLALMYVCVGLKAQTMHTLIFVNTQENTIAHGDRTIDRTQDYENMKTFFSNIAQILGYTNNMCAHGLQRDFNSTVIDREINNLNVKKNDIVVFYYSGHGGNMNNDLWPSFELTDSYYWQTDILRKLKAKCTDGNSFKPKLLLCVADCCNNVHEGGVRGTFDPGENTAGIKKLFTGFPGRYTITMSASIKGQLSSSDRQDGALFGIALREAITDGARTFIWEDVLAYAKKRTIQLASRYINRQTGKPEYQEPQYSIKISGDPFDD